METFWHHNITLTLKCLIVSIIVNIIDYRVEKMLLRTINAVLPFFNTC